MRIGGFQKTSLIDYPGKVSAIVFTMGCNFKCSYCHNPELVDAALFPEAIKPQSILDYLKTRTGKLDAVSVTGGEPTLHPDLPDFLASIKKMGFAIKLDSNGTNPDMLWKILEKKLVDYMAMDIKGPIERYEEVTGMPVDTRAVQRSVELIMHSDVPYEFRTTILPGQQSREDFQEIGEWIQGAQTYYLQKFIPTKANDPSVLDKKTQTHEELADLQSLMREYVNDCHIR